MAAAAFVAAAAVACTHGPGASRAPSPPAEALWTYEVALRETSEGGELDVQASFDGATGGGLMVDEGAAPFVEALTVGDAAAAPARLGDAGWSSQCTPHCRLSYRFRLGDAARALADVDLALEAGRTLFSPPSAWLVRPAGGTEALAGRYRFRVTTPAGVEFATGVRPAAGESDVYEAAIGDLDEAAFSAFGPFRRRHLADPHVDAAIADVAIEEAAVMRWLTTSVTAVTEYFGRVPDHRVLLLVAPGTSPVMRGVTLAGGGASVFLRIGTAVTPERLADDWVAPHELIHVAFPTVDYRSTWFSEGLASYVEPVARVRIGVLSPEKMWADLVDGMPQGLPGPGDTGLAGTREWGRVYWGGALFCLLADVEIHERTGGAKGLDDVIRAIAATGANVESYWPMERVLEAGDRATGTQVLHELYARLALSPGTEDLDALWARLGIIRSGKTVRFDDAAPLARYRAAIAGPRVPQASQDLSRH